MITTETIVDYADRGANIGSEFYLIVPSRVDTTASMQALERIGYTLVKEYCYENRYGSMHVYYYSF